LQFSVTLPDKTDVADLAVGVAAMAADFPI
jgi:hypothetical protein